VLLSLAFLVLINGLNCGVTSDFSDSIRCDVAGPQVNPIPLGPTHGGSFSLYETDDSTPTHLLDFETTYGGLTGSWSSAPAFVGTVAAVLVSQQSGGYTDNPNFVPSKILTRPGKTNFELVIKYTPPGPGTFVVSAVIQSGEVLLGGTTTQCATDTGSTGFSYQMFSSSSSTGTQTGLTSGTIHGSGNNGPVSTSVTFTGGSFGYLVLARPGNSMPCTGGFVELTVTENGNSVGDPFFKGFQGQTFEFKGQPSLSYHLFSDPFISVNAEFASTLAPYTPNGTVMKTLNISFENHRLTLVRDWIGGKSISLLSDSTKTTVQEGKSILLGECYSLSYLTVQPLLPSSLLFQTPKHKILVQYAHQADKHINNTYFNVHYDIPLEDPDSLGGLLGQTAKADATISTDEMLFIVPMNGRAKTDKFEGVSIC